MLLESEIPRGAIFCWWEVEYQFYTRVSEMPRTVLLLEIFFAMSFAVNLHHP